MIGGVHSKAPQMFEAFASRDFDSWLATQRVSLACTTYQGGKLLLIGRGVEGRLSIFERSFDRCLGLWSDGQALWLASAFQLWKLTNVLAEGETLDGFDRLYVPRAGYTTGDVDAHDLAVDAAGRPLFVATRFGCLATLSERFGFESLWRPAFLSRLAAEDRCHLNGLAMQNGRPLYVTACSQTDVVDGWRDQRRDGGCVIDITDNRVVADRLSMPHSPRLHEQRLWLLDSGRGYLGFVDQGRFERLTFCPGYARGLAFVDRFAVVGLSKPREHSFIGLELQEQLESRRAQAWCGLQIIDLGSGDVVHWLRIEGNIAELYDVAVLPGVVRPKALGFKTDEISRNVWAVDGGTVKRWTS